VTLNQLVILVRLVANRRGEETGLNRQAATGTYRHPQEAPACRAAGRQDAQVVAKTARVGEWVTTGGGDRFCRDAISVIPM